MPIGAKFGTEPRSKRRPDLRFSHPTLAAIYDAIEPVRPDLDAYLQLVDELSVEAVLDVGCGTGTFACMLAQRGLHVIAVDPAVASLNVARRKDGADKVRWIHGDATTLPPIQVDLATMTGNVAQVFITEEEWVSTLAGVRRALRPTGRLVFESRDPAKKAWLGWNRADSYQRFDIDGFGPVQKWDELLDVRDDLVSFRTTFVFDRDGRSFISDSTLRFREPDAIADSLSKGGFVVEEVRGAPDRPGLEFVFIARLSR